MHLTSEKQYSATCIRIKELLKVVTNETSADDPNFIELDLLSELAANYEEKYYPINPPSLIDTIKLRMSEMNLNQTKLSELLEISPSRVSELLSGKSEPTLQVARRISKCLNIEPNVVLGV